MTNDRLDGAPGEDWIHLQHVKIRCVLGVYPAERVQPRPVWMDISLQCDTRPAAASDKLEDTLNYELIEAEIVGMAKKGRYHLVEALAERVAETCLAHAAVAAVRVRVEKPGALPLTQNVAVEILRRK